MSLYAALALVTYCFIAISAFAFLRLRGYEIDLAQVARPGRWREFGQVQSKLFQVRGQEALAAGRVNEAVLALSIAYERDPANRAAGRLLAQLWQLTQPTLSDRIYASLIRLPGPEREEIARQWYGALLRRGNFPQIAQLSAEIVSDPSILRAPWASILLESTRMERGGVINNGSSAWRNRLPEELRTILDLELRPSSSSAEEHGIRLSARPQVDMDMPFVVYQAVTLELNQGRAAEALALIEKWGDKLDPYNRTALRLDAFALSGWFHLRENEFESLLSSNFNGGTYPMLCAHLIRFPDAQLADKVFKRLEQSPIPPDTELGPREYAALYCLAGSMKDKHRLAILKQSLEKATGERYRALSRLEDFFLGNSMDPRLGAHLPVLVHVPNEVAWALFKRQAKMTRPTLHNGRLRSP